MATFTSTSGSYTTTLTVTQTSQSTQNNQSTLTYSLTLTKNSGTGLWNNNSCPWSITIDGSTVASGSFTYDFRSYSSLTLKGSTTTTVTHNSDGTKTVACSASVNMNNEPYVYVMKPSGDLALTTIPRASDVSVSNYSIANTTGSISATITSKASFYHKWRWRMNSGTWSSWTNKGLIASTSSTVTVANTTLLAQLPTATSGSFNIEVATYSDSGYATLVGTKSASATVSVNTANIKPSVSLENIGLNSTPIANYAVAGYSKVQSAWTTTNSSGASSVTTYFTTSHGSLATTSSTSTSGTTVSGYIPSSSANYTLTISAYAKDSRGATSSTVSKSITVYGYTPPTATLNAYRVASSSSTTEDGAGTYAYVTFSGAVSSSVNSKNTIQSTTCTYSGSISGTATNGGHYALSDTQTVTFTLTVRDKVTSSVAQKTINTATYPLDLYDNGSGSVGVGLGTVAVAGYVKSIMPIRVNNSDSSGYVELREDGEGGTIDIASKSGKVFEIDAYNDNALRCFSYDDGGNFVTCDFNRTTGVFYSSGGFYGNLTGNATSATNATNATNANIALTDVTNFTSYYVPFLLGVSGNENRRLRANDGFVYRTRQGTTSSLGYSILYLGNSTASGTDGNKQGQLRIFSSGTNYTEIAAQDIGGSTVYLPAPAPINSYIVNCAEIWSGSLTGGNSITITGATVYNRLSIFAWMAGELNMTWMIDVGYITTSDRYFSHGEMIYISNPGGWYMTHAEVAIKKSGTDLVVNFKNARNIRVDGTNHVVTQNGSTNYKIYKIYGYM